MFRKFNKWLGNVLTNGLATMEMFYIVSFLVIAPLALQRPSTLIGWIQYASTAILQAVALPLLGYTTKISGNKQERLLQETHDAVMKELSIIRQQQQNDKEEHALIRKVLVETQQITDEIKPPKN